MKKVIKKLKLNELPKENLCSKELRSIKGGVCACISACLSESSEGFWDGYATGSASCGC